jgi:hypothetical protein
MRFEIIVKHNTENTDKAIEIIDNLKKIARKNNLDLSTELDINIDVSNNKTVELSPSLYLEKDELYPEKGMNFHSDYLEQYANDKEVLVDLINTIQEAS